MGVEGRAGCPGSLPLPPHSLVPQGELACGTLASGKHPQEMLDPEVV